MQLPILTMPHPVLTTPCAPVPQVTEDIRRFLQDMVETMHQAGGIGLAAPQVGHSLRCIVMDLGRGLGGGIYCCINPEIVRHAGIQKNPEGCLSIPGRVVTRDRFAKVTLAYTDEHGMARRLKATGLLALCIQHELDHLDGILMTAG